MFQFKVAMPLGKDFALEFDADEEMVQINVHDGQDTSMITRMRLISDERGLVVQMWDHDVWWKHTPKSEVVVVAKGTETSEPKGNKILIVRSDDGQIDKVISNIPCSAILIDEDVEGAEDDEIETINGKEAVVLPIENEVNEALVVDTFHSYCGRVISNRPGVSILDDDDINTTGAEEDHSDEICPCRDPDCSRPWGHEEEF